MQTCGFCGGRGWVYGRTHDNHGYQVHETPPQVGCEYCGGAGVCPQGHELLPARPPTPPPDSGGNPAWG